MNFTEYELRIMNTKPRFLNSEEKKIRRKCKRKIEYQKNKETEKKYYRQNKEYYQSYRNANKQKKIKDQELIRVIIAKIN